MSLSSFAQTQLIDTMLAQVPDYSPPPTAFSSNEVTLNFDALKTAPAILTLDFPDTTSANIPLVEFEPRAGYIITKNSDGSIKAFSPDPNLPNNAFSYKWTGTNDEYDVLLTVTKGHLTGLITGNFARYGLKRSYDGSKYFMTKIRLQGYATMDEDSSINKANILTYTNEPNNTFTSNIKEFNQNINQENMQKKGVNPRLLTSLVVYTEQARIDAGGNINDQNDTSAIEDLIETAIDHANFALVHSNAYTGINLFYTAKLNGFNLTGNPINDRKKFKNLLSVKTLRNQVNADFVSAIVRNATNDFGLFPACGISYVQSAPGCSGSAPDPNCSWGDDFNDFAYNLIAQNCAIWNDTFTHELGHLLGGNHINNGIQITNTNYVNAVINNGFPSAFAHIINGHFASILSIDFNTPRRLYFSNPLNFVDGIATGRNPDRNNAQVARNLAWYMQDFRPLPDLIFNNGFE